MSSCQQNLTKFVLWPSCFLAVKSRFHLCVLSLFLLIINFGCLFTDCDVSLSLSSFLCRSQSCNSISDSLHPNICYPYLLFIPPYLVAFIWDCSLYVYFYICFIQVVNYVLYEECQTISLLLMLGMLVCHIAIL